MIDDLLDNLRWYEFPEVLKEITQGLPVFFDRNHLIPSLLEAMLQYKEYNLFSNNLNFNDYCVEAYRNTSDVPVSIEEVVEDFNIISARDLTWVKRTFYAHLADLEMYEYNALEEITFPKNYINRYVAYGSLEEDLINQKVYDKFKNQTDLHQLYGACLEKMNELYKKSLPK